MKAGIGFLGTGFMGQLAHLDNYAEDPDCAVVAVAEMRPRLAQAVAAKYGIRKVYADHRDLLDDGEELVGLAKQQGLTYAVGFMKRYDPGVQLARPTIQTLIQSGDLGALRLVDACCYAGDWLQNAGRPVSVAEDTQAPPIVRRYPDHVPPERQDAYDYLINVFAHNVNLIRYLLPGGEMTVVNGLFHGQALSINLTAQDVLINLRGFPLHYHDWNEETRVVFDRGHVSVRTPVPMNRQAVASVTVYRALPPAREARELFVEVDWGFRRQARGFVAALLGGPPPLAPGEDCLKDVAILEDVMRKAIFV